MTLARDSDDSLPDSHWLDPNLVPIANEIPAPVRCRFTVFPVEFNQSGWRVRR